MGGATPRPRSPQGPQGPEGLPDPVRPGRPPVNRARLLGSVLVPVVLAAAAGAAVLPRAQAARDASDRQAAAALAGANLPAGIVAALNEAPAEPLAPRTRALPTAVAPPSTIVTIEALTPPPAVDGAAGAPTGEVVDTAAVQVAASTVLASHGAAVTDGSTGIPVTVLAAYKKAEALLAAVEPSCHLPWWVLAGIGRIESDHASGGRVDADGTTRGRILGVVLDGSLPGTSVVTDTDDGQWDGDATYDRAVGPMQFLPGSWRAWGKDGNGDGVADPNNVFDAATGAGYLLCSAGDLSTPANLSRAILMYNHSASYVASVLQWGTAYRDGATPSPDSAGSVPATPVLKDTSPPSVTVTTPSAASTSPTTRPGTTSAPAPATSAPSSTSRSPSTAPTSPPRTSPSPSTSTATPASTTITTTPASTTTTTTTPATTATPATMTTTTTTTTSPPTTTSTTITRPPTTTSTTLATASTSTPTTASTTSTTTTAP